MKDLKKQEKKPAAVDEEAAPEQQIEYTFDEHLGEEQPIVCQPPTNYTINETASQM